MTIRVRNSIGGREPGDKSKNASYLTESSAGKANKCIFESYFP